MKITEAINAVACNKPTSGYTIMCEALDMAVDTLEKQMPKRPWLCLGIRLPELSYSQSYHRKTIL